MGAFIQDSTGISSDEASASFYSEQVPMYITGSWMAGYIMTNAANPEHFSVAPIPVVNSANAVVTDFMGGGSDTLMVAASTKNPDLAAAAAFEITRGVSKYAYLSGAGIPAWNVDYDASTVPAITQEVASLAAKATSYTLWFDTLMTSDDAGAYLSLLQSLYTGDITPEEFVQSMDAQLSK
jgi:raffinose/stachyose/melibiose transport system substrate-binding protein